MNEFPVAPALDVDMDEIAVLQAINEIIAPAADIGGAWCWGRSEDATTASGGDPSGSMAR